MAHGDDIRRAVRAAFIFQQLTLEVAALKSGVPIATARRWKREALDAGDDWERARGAQMIAGGGIEDVVRQTLAVVVQQVQATVEQIQREPDMDPVTKVKLLSSLADAYNKLMSVAKRLMPETDRLAVAMGVLKDLSEFVRSDHPRHMQAFAEILEGFGARLAKAKG